jgi:transcription elongation factor Elf1
MGKYRYVTNRVLCNKSGQELGRIRVLVKKDSDVAETDYVCPECSYSEHLECKWKRPFAIHCSKCGFLIRLPRLKDEIKREKKRSKSRENK